MILLKVILFVEKEAKKKSFCYFLKFKQNKLIKQLSSNVLFTEHEEKML